MSDEAVRQYLSQMKKPASGAAPVPPTTASSSAAQARASKAKKRGNIADAPTEDDQGSHDAVPLAAEDVTLVPALIEEQEQSGNLSPITEKRASTAAKGKGKKRAKISSPTQVEKKAKGARPRG